MREIFTDFMRLERRPDGTVRIPLGSQELSPDLEGLTDGERVCLVYPHELEAEATVAHERRDGDTVWYASISSMAAIRDIHPETLAERDQAPASAHHE
jgi:hypothetical protein